MPKKVRETPEPKGSQSTATVIKPKAYTDLVAKVSSANKQMETGRKNKAELIRDAVDSDNLHAGAFRQVMALRKMDPVKRNEWLFHFEIYCEREKFAREDLLPDRAGGGDDEGGDDEGQPEHAAAIAGEDETDLRPRHLRQPNASVTSTVDQIKEDALNKVGRGNPPAKPH